MISITVSARSDEAVSGTVRDAPWARAGSRLGHRPIPSAAIIAAIAAMIATLGIGLWPNLLPARAQGASLTVPLTASSDLALTVMLIIALVGLPFVLAYTLWVYRTFRGPVRLDEHSY